MSGHSSDEASEATLADLSPPCLVVDDARMERHIDRLRGRLASLGVQFRPPLKTCKSIEIAHRVIPRASSLNVRGIGGEAIVPTTF